MDQYRTEKYTGSVNGLSVWKIWKLDPDSRAYIFVGNGAGKTEAEAITDLETPEEEWEE